MSADGSALFGPLSALGGNPHGAPAYSELAATGEARGPNTVDFEVLAAAGVAHGAAVGAVQFERLAATGTTVPVNVASGAGFFEAMEAAGGINPRGAVSLELMTGLGHARGPVTGSVSFEPMVVNGRAGAAAFERLQASGFASVEDSEVYTAKVMNTRNSAVTEYTGFEFNSFARIGRDWYAAGPEGVFRLDGETDDGDAISWAFRTGQLDGGDSGLKRLPEVLATLRGNHAVRVRVWKDDNVFFDYTMPAAKKNTLRQQRVKVGRGMRSRWFMVELSGQNHAEIDTLQINMTDTTRRIG